MEITYEYIKKEDTAAQILEREKKKKQKPHFSKVEVYPEVENLTSYMQQQKPSA